MPAPKTIKQLLPFWILALFLLQISCFGQFRNFGAAAQIKPQPTNLYTTYGYFDAIRETGVGFQYQLTNKYNLDFSVYLINKQLDVSSIIKQWDYYDLIGYGISFKPKLLLSRLSRFYIGPNLAFEKLRHNPVWVEYYGGRGTDLYKNLETANGWGYTIGITTGSRMTANHIVVEPFLGIGLSSCRLNKTVYETDRRNSDPSIQYPYTGNIKMDYFQMNIGLKMGYSFKNSKKHEAIDKKMDAYYTPKLNSLQKYFRTVKPEELSSNAHLKKANALVKHIDRNFLWKYKRYYLDTVKLYGKFDEYFLKIEEKIIKSNR